MEISTATELELDDIRVEVADYKAAVRYIHMLYTQQMQSYHRHLKKDHGDKRHSALWKTCPGSPCATDRADLVKVEAVMERYKKLCGDPRGSPDGANQ